MKVQKKVIEAETPKPIQVSGITPELREKLRELAKRNDRNMSSQIRELIREADADGDA